LNNTDFSIVIVKRHWNWFTTANVVRIKDAHCPVVLGHGIQTENNTVLDSITSEQFKVAEDDV